MDATRNNAAGGEGQNPTSASAAAGRAALLLTESLMHALVANGTISREEFVDIVEGAAEVEQDLAMADAMPPSNCGKSILHPLAHTFKMEIGR